MYGGDEAKGNSMNGVINVRVCLEEYFSSVEGDWWVFLLSFLVGNGEVKRWGWFFCIDSHSGCFGEGREAFFSYCNECGEVVITT